MNKFKNLFLIIIILVPLGLAASRTGPELNGEHSWRQSLYADISRNYRNGSARFLYPSVSWAGEKPGAVGCEFPLIPYLAAIISRNPVSAGRIISLISLAAILILTFQLVNSISDKQTAVFSALFLVYNPAFLYYGRCFMPDIPALALSLATLLMFLRWSATGSWKDWAVMVTVSSLAGLLKLSHFLIFFPIGYLVITRPEIIKKKSLWLGLVINLVIPLIWYLHALRISQSNYPYFFAGLYRPNWIFTGGLKDLLHFGYYGKIFSRLFSYGFFTPAGSILLLSGFFCLPSRYGKGLLPVWMAGFALFLLSAPQGQAIHEYYQLPFLVPGSIVMALAARAAGKRLREIKFGRVILALLLGMIILPQLYYSLGSARYRLLPSVATAAAGRFIRAYSSPEDRLILYSSVPELRNFPLIFYTADRRGWLFDNLLYGKENWARSGSNMKYQVERRQDFWQNLREEKAKGTIIVVLKPNEFDPTYLFLRVLFERMPYEGSFYEIYRW